eukprot:TRINITY_DN8950_c0_g2_i1.p1 TRINITY_DN8950_c0_g2~~TRINITY_DN8950_c0_g2_i1.p1  ORF type:complete len:627 (+),score=116.75 TRINITY_DN8950_c0_g2_i1:53-1882(+)
MPSDTETSISLGSTSGDEDDGSSSTKSINRFIDDEAEEVQENEEDDEEADDDDLNDLAQFDEFSFPQSVERRSRARSEQSTSAPVMMVPAPNMDDDEGFASRALSLGRVSYTAASEADDFEAPSPPTEEELRIERKALEGSTRLSLELRSLEMIGLNILKNEPSAQDFLVWLRKLLNVRHSESIRHALITKVGSQMRAAYLYDRVLRRYWSGKHTKQHLSQDTQQSTDTSYSNMPLAVYSAETIVKVPLISRETALVGNDLSQGMATAIGNRAIGKIVPHNKLSPEPKTEDALAIICASALEIIGSEVASGTYAASEGQIRMRAFLAPAHTGMVVTGIVKSFSKPDYSINKPIFKAVGSAIISLGDCDVPVEFGAEVPERSLAIGRIWVLRMTKDASKNNRWCLKFDQDPYLYGEEGDTSDFTALTPQQISNMTKNRREPNMRESQNWAAATDKKTGWRCVIQLPETGYWDPEAYSDLMCVRNIGGVEVNISTSTSRHKRGATTAVLAYSEHQKGTGRKIKTSQRCTIRLSVNGEVFESVVSVPHLKNQKLASKFLARKTARCIEVVLQLYQSGISPKAGTLSFVEGKMEHDDDLSLIEDPPIKRFKAE